MNDDTWGQARESLRRELSLANYHQWIEPLDFVSFDDSVVTLSAPTKFMCDWVDRNYGEKILKMLSTSGASINRVLFVVAFSADNRSARVRQPNGTKRKDEPSISAVSRRGGDIPDAPLDPRFTFDTFVVGKPNELASAAARRVAEGARVTFNPLFLYGGVGVGKTHLMHAISWEMKHRHPEKRVVYLSAEQFMYRFVQALRERRQIDFKSIFRSVDVLMVDDVQFIAGKDSTQDEFFHTFNALKDQGRQIIISGDRSPSELDGIEERIRSRLGCGLMVDLHPTDFELRLLILETKTEQFRKEYPNINISPEVLQFMARRISANVRVLEGALNRLFAFASLIGREITPERAQECLSDILRASDRKVTVDVIQRKVAAHYNIRLADMLGARRVRSIARPRQIAMYLSKTLTSRSYPEIGKMFGGKDHTTVLHAYRKIADLRQTDNALDEDLELLRRDLEE